MSDVQTGPIEGFWGVIPAGGSGTRLWPLSRANSPKFLHDLTGSGRSLLQGTVDRLTPLCATNLLIVTGAAHAAAVREQLPELGPNDLLVEPSPRESMPAIGLAAAILERRDPDAVLGSFAADQVVGDTSVFEDTVRQAVEVARQGYLVTVAIRPTYPSTGFGYIRAGSNLGIAGAPDATIVKAFVEKPDGPTAQAYVATGEYAWNAGMFVVRAATLMEMIEHYQPRLAEYLRIIADNPFRLSELWPRLTKIAIDNAIAEPAAVDGRVATVPGSFTWDDVGDFASLASLLGRTRRQGARRERTRRHAGRDRRRRAALRPHRRRHGHRGRRRRRHRRRGTRHDARTSAGRQEDRRTTQAEWPRRPHLRLTKLEH